MGDVLDLELWRKVRREAPKPEPNATMIAAAENKRMVERLAERSRDAMAELSTMDDLPCDVEK